METPSKKRKPSHQLQMEMVGGGGDSDEDGDQPMQDLNQTAIAGDECRRRGRSAYLVACHWDWSVNSKPYAVYKVDVASSSNPNPSRRVKRRRRLRQLARLATSAGGKTFTSVRSAHRAWIVGAGGNPGGDTIIFDTKTNKVIHGPALNSAKWRPILTSVGDKVYAFSRTPSYTKDPDFPPWFEVLDLSNARIVTIGDRSHHLEGCSWIELPRPPCFPWKLRPFRYRMLPVVVVRSYAVVGAYILVSFNQTWGTLAFDTNSSADDGSYKWHKVDDKRLPFIGQATPHGSLFLGLSKENGPINAYHIDVTNSDRDHAPNLSITVLPVKYKEHEVDAGPCFFSLEDGRFCSFSLSLDGLSVVPHPKTLELFPMAAHVNLRTYETEDPSSLEVPEETLLAAKPEVAVCSQQKQAFKISSSSHGFTPFAFTFLSI